MLRTRTQFSALVDRSNLIQSTSSPLFLGSLLPPGNFASSIVVSGSELRFVEEGIIGGLENEWEEIGRKRN